jgi:site-specific recombinase XerD
LTAEIVDRVKEEGLQRARSVARKIAHESPTLADLSSEQLEQVARVVMAETLKDELRRAAELEKIPYRAERDLFLSRASRTGSAHTRKNYQAALDRLETWSKVQGISPLELTPARADDWIESMKADGKAPATVRLAVSGASAFWTWLERRHVEIRNPFRGTKARPTKKAKRTLEVPSEKDIALLERSAEGWLRAAVVVMGKLGLRAGALPSLSVSGGKYTCHSKGKDLSGKVPDAVRDAILAAELTLRAPFGEKKVEQIEDAFRYLTKKLRAAGQIAGRYSAHDLRHAYAVRFYRETHDIYGLRVAMQHASVSVTETYLRSLSEGGADVDIEKCK